MSGASPLCGEQATSFKISDVTLSDVTILGIGVSFGIFSSSSCQP